MLQKTVHITTALVVIILPLTALAGGYSELLPNSFPLMNAAGLTPSDKIDQLKHLLVKHQGELNSCAALVNTNRKTYLSKTTQVMATSGSAAFRFRKSEQGAPQLQLENVECISPLVEGCIVGIFRNSEFKERLQDVAIDGRIVVNFDCNLAVERNLITRDDINYQCTAKWGFYDMSAAYPETVLKMWK